MGDTGALVNKEMAEVVDKKLQLMSVNEAVDTADSKDANADNKDANADNKDATVDNKDDANVDHKGDAVDPGKLFLEYFFVYSKTACCLTFYFYICAFKKYYYSMCTVEF